MPRTTLTRRQFLRSGLLATLGLAAGARCAARYRPPDATPPTLEELLDEGVREASYYRRLDGDAVQCELCFRACRVPEGGRGFCRTRINVEGRYYTLVYARPAALQVDPVEKEPAHHLLPGTVIFCTGTAGCNNRCKFCHNWHLSQRSFEEIRHIPLTPDETVDRARQAGCHGVSFTYNEPTIFYEHMLDVARLAKQVGLATLFHTNGGINPEPLGELLPYMDAATVDLKAFTPQFYQELAASELDPVLRSLELIHKSATQLEIVNLMIPTYNDDPDDVRAMCRWIADTLSVEVPIHFNRFSPAYQLTALPRTPIETLEQAARIADEAGLHYVYIGNYPGHRRNSTYCPQCGQLLIERRHFSVLSIALDQGHCIACGHPIPGFWLTA